MKTNFDGDLLAFNKFLVELSDENRVFSPEYTIDGNGLIFLIRITVNTVRGSFIAGVSLEFDSDDAYFLGECDNWPIPEVGEAIDFTRTFTSDELTSLVTEAIKFLPRG